MENFEVVVEESHNGVRIDKYLTEILPDFSRSRVQQLIEEGYVEVNDLETKSNYKVKTGDIVSAEWPEDEALEVEAEDMDLDILYEDSDIIVINKPKGMVVHPGAGNPSHTLVNGLLAHCKDLSGINGVLRPGIVHRIDKDTSGCLVVAKNDLAHQVLSEQLSSKTMRRTYLALVHGVLNHNVGTIEAPIGRDKNDRQKMTVTSIGSRPAVTHFKVIQRYEKMTLVECQLETGRTHQIRVHFQYIGYPIVGDPKYSIKHTLETQGQCLHAYKIEFRHPRTDELMQFSAEMPDVFKKVLEELV
ncbi:MAG: RluA family pseudouridine synthase [Erysipelotrichaceae bacterium]|nr:RluA family pseudouridine synthase [Erysipelotrichaceae bacterium]